MGGQHQWPTSVVGSWRNVHRWSMEGIICIRLIPISIATWQIIVNHTVKITGEKLTINNNILMGRLTPQIIKALVPSLLSFSAKKIM